MKKFLAWILVLLCMFSFASAEQGGIATLGELAELAEVLPEGELPESAPFIPDSLDKSVFGSDDRTTISKTGQYPYSAIAYIEFRGKCGCDWTGSGFMISKNAMATAGHCLVCKEHNQWVDYMTMYFGYKNAKNYTYRYADPTTYWRNSSYQNGNYPTTEDYAYIKLEKNVGDKVGWFGVRHSTAPSYETFSVSGYRHGVLKTSYGTITQEGDKLYKYTIDTEPGYSGCPVYDSEYYAVGINICHDSSANYARRFTSNLVSEMYSDGIFD